MPKLLKNLHSDIAPREGRRELADWSLNCQTQALTWEGGDWSLAGQLESRTGSGSRTLGLQGNILARDESVARAGWIELETLAGQRSPGIEDIFLVGTRPLPQANLTCLCRHPLSRDYLVAATLDSQLLLLDARLSRNLQILARVSLAATLVSLVCCGTSLVGLEKSPGSALHIINTTTAEDSKPGLERAGHISLPLAVTALAENDSGSVWGLGTGGEIYRLPMSNLELSAPINEGHLRPGPAEAAQPNYLQAIYRAFASRPFSRRVPESKPGAGPGFAYDGLHYWSSALDRGHMNGRILRVHDQSGALLRSFKTPPEVSVTSLNYLHNNLLVLDLENQRLHQYHLGDSMQPVASLASTRQVHPGYLPAGTPASGGIHDLCLLYVGGEGRSRVHRYDQDKLLPLVGYLSPAGEVQDFFMDGFLLLAQYSPLLSGRAMGLDLRGRSSRREDWLALFDEYFHPQANLQALEDCAAQVNRQLETSPPRLVKVVLSIPTADRRCRNWDGQGFSLAADSHRVEATAWAMQTLLDRWQKAAYQHLELVGFYYMTEQGAYDDPVLHAFPQLCREYGLRSFAIPGITSSWMTEFNRAGFDCVALQSSHAFWQPFNRPPGYLLKCAGAIAREFGMGMEVELPYDVLAPAGGQKLRDYLAMAQLQGWAGAFKAYFQSYNLIQTLSASPSGEARQLYDALYQLSRAGYQIEAESTVLAGSAVPVDWQASWSADKGPIWLRLNLEGHQGVFRLTDLAVE